MSDVYVGTFDVSIPGLRFIDRSSEGYLDIVYDLGLQQKPQSMPYDAGPYMLTVTKNGAPFYQVLRPTHFYEASWWIDIVPVTAADVKRSPAELISTGCVPPIGKIPDLPVYLPTAGSVTFGGPMTLSSDTVGYEPTTGGRGGIGIVSDNGAEYLMTGDARNMLEDARGSATQPIWNYTTTGMLLDMIAMPKITHYYSSAQGGYPIWLGPFPVNPTDIRPVPVPLPPYNPSTPQTAHMEPLTEIPSMATGAPRYVRALQQRVNRALNADNTGASVYGAASIWSNEVRGIAWAGRALFSCYKATLYAEQLGTLPKDCYPSSHCVHIIDNQVDQFHKYVETELFFKIFATLGGGRIAFWQCDMVNQMLGLYAQEWPEVWGDIYIKVLRNLMARVNGDGLSQWPIGAPTWYWGDLGFITPNGIDPYDDYKMLWKNWSADEAGGLHPDQFYSAAQITALNNDPTNGGAYVNPTEYQSWMYGGLAFAVYLDRGKLTGRVSAAYPRLEAAFTEQHAMMVKWGKNGADKVLLAQCSISVAPLPPVVIVPPIEPPVVTPPTEPPGGIHMSETKFTITPGASKQLDFLDDAGQRAVLTGTPTFEQTNPDIFTLALNDTGLLATSRGVPGESKITVHAQGVGSLIATSVGTVARPLSTSLNLIPRVG